MRRIVIFGYFGCGNLGDETNLVQLVRFIKQNFSQAEISVITSAPAASAKELNVHTTGKFNLIGIINALARADILIGGGGSLFQDRTSLRSLLYYAGFVFLARLFGVKVFLYGQGIGPVHSRMGKLISEWALSMSDVITVRDRLSIITLAELNVRAPEVHVTAEPLLLKNELPEAGVKEYWGKYVSQKPYKIGLALQDFQGLKPYCQYHRRLWEQILDFLCLERQVEIYLLPVHRQDLILQERLAADSGCVILPTHDRWEDLQAAIGGLDLLVSTRLHGLVAAVVQNVPCLGLAADPKIEGFCLQLGVPFISLLPEAESLHLCNRILKLLTQPVAERRPWQPQLRFWKARALENEVLLKEFITQNYETQGIYRRYSD